MNTSFTFKSYHFDAATKKLSMHYAYDTLSFTESYHFDFDFVNYDPAVLDRAIQILFFIAGVSYYKVYAPPTIVIEAGEIDEALSGFLSRTYQKGLGEFFYINKLDPRTVITFPITTYALALMPRPVNEGLLVGIGGGKDSLVSVDLLRGRVEKLATWSVNHRPQLTPLIDRIGLQHFWVAREWDKQLLEVKHMTGTYSGHIPISALFASVGSVVAILAGYRDSVVSNEQSANEPTLQYDGIAINHQYSKSQDFEADFQSLLRHSFGDSLRYYSFLRPLSELRIAELFADSSFEKYHDVFSSCNRAFTHDNNRLFWDGKCAKCAFVFLALTPFVTREKLEDLFGGTNLLLDGSLAPTYRQLLGIEGDKPLDCVGEIKESRTAMRLAQKIYPQLVTYDFELPSDYNYRAIASHEMPAEIYEIFKSSLA